MSKGKELVHADVYDMKYYFMHKPSCFKITDNAFSVVHAGLF